MLQAATLTSSERSGVVVPNSALLINKSNCNRVSNGITAWIVQPWQKLGVLRVNGDMDVEVKLDPTQVGLGNTVKCFLCPVLQCQLNR